MRTGLALLCAVWLLGLMIGPGHAGPWPRDKAAVFLALSRTSGAFGESQVYGEYGLGRRRTLVTEAATSRAGWRGQLLVRHALSPGKRGAQMALALGVVVVAPQTIKPQAALRVGLLWGKGFSGRLPGWVSVEALADLGPGGVATRSTTTLGLKPRPELMSILQLQTETSATGVMIHAATSMVWEARKGLSLELGLRQGIVGSAARQVKLGSWISF